MDPGRNGASFLGSFSIFKDLEYVGEKIGKGWAFGNTWGFVCLNVLVSARQDCALVQKSAG